MGKRILVSVIAIPLLAYIIYAPYAHNLLFFLFLLALSTLAAREIHLLTGNIAPFKGQGASVLWFVLPPIFLYGAAFTNHFLNVTPDAMLYTAVGIITALSVLSLILFGVREGSRKLVFFCASAVYAGVCTLLILQLRGEHRGFMYVYFLFSASWVSDAAAYIIGSRFGRRKGIVACSPNKSLEGYVGAFVVTMIMANGFKLLFRSGFDPTLLQVNLLGFCIALTAPLGDLGESCFKRKAGVKDSSSLFPGMGGVLDIFDSILFSVPVYYVLVMYII
jgi:phosphatidate cytidylyltransferase